MQILDIMKHHGYRAVDVEYLEWLFATSGWGVPTMVFPHGLHVSKALGPLMLTAVIDEEDLSIHFEYEGCKPKDFKKAVFMAFAEALDLARFFGVETVMIMGDSFQKDRLYKKFLERNGIAFRDTGIGLAVEAT